MVIMLHKLLLTCVCPGGKSCDCFGTEVAVAPCTLCSIMLVSCDGVNATAGAPVPTLLHS